MNTWLKVGWAVFWIVMGWCGILTCNSIPPKPSKTQLQQETCVFALLQDTVSPEVVEYCKTLLSD